ncbi:MAG: hypothetical protein ACYCQK_03910 [Acidiferrobacteraceae bacterium]
MRKVLQALGIVFLVVLVAGGSIIGYAAYTGSRLDASSRKYVDSAVPAIVANWSEQALMSRADPRLLRATSPYEMAQLFAWLRTLGPMERYCGSTGQATEFLSARSGRIVSARYTACAQFAKGTASIDVALVRNRDKGWQIVGFHVNSPALLPR